MTPRWSDEWGRARAIFRGWALRLGATIALLVGGLVWAVTFLIAWAPRLPWWENFGVVLTTLVGVPLLVLGIWVAWFGQVRRRLWARWADVA